MRRTLASLASLGLLFAASIAQAAVHRMPWGSTKAGQKVDLYELSDPDLTVQLTTFGARVVSIEAPDRNGQKADVVLGYKNLAGYENDTKSYFGAIVGRYGNRIAGGTFSIDGKTYHVPLNNGPNALHGGTVGFDRKVWTATPIDNGNGVEFSLVSPNGDMGFPGTLTVHVRYLLQGKSLRLEYSATTDRPTVVNLTNHTYYNLGGQASGSILNELLTLNADSYTPVNSTLIPTGQLAPVAGTPMDFRKPTPIGKNIHANNPQLAYGSGGYDLNFVLNGYKQPGMHQAAHVLDPASGRTLNVTTTQPAVQVYTSNSMDGSIIGYTGVPYKRYAGLALETQHFPDSPNQPNFPSTLLKPGQTLHSETVLTFGTAK